MPIKQTQLVVVLLFTSLQVFASHSFGGLDMCALYPEVMPPGLPAEQLPDSGGAGARLMQTYCTQCHELPGPGRHTAEEWPSVLQRMLTLMEVANRFGGLMGDIKNPDKEEREQLRLYLSRHALKPVQETPAGFGARAFENHCGACHALPNPLQHEHDAWPGLLKRMQRNMMVMKYAPPSPEVMLQIQHYLQSVSAVDSVALHATGKQEPTGGARRTAAASIQPESGMALGPFLLLVILGLVRWRINAGKKPPSTHADST